MINVKVHCGDGRVLCAWRSDGRKGWTVRLPGGTVHWSRCPTGQVERRLCEVATRDHAGVEDTEIFVEEGDSLRHIRPYVRVT